MIECMHLQDEVSQHRKVYAAYASIRTGMLMSCFSCNPIIMCNDLAVAYACWLSQLSKSRRPFDMLLEMTISQMERPQINERIIKHDT